MADEKEFKVIDRRASSGATDETPKSKIEEPHPGPGFVMKDAPSEESTAHQIDFPTFIFSLATGAFIHLGLAPDPSTGKLQKSLAMAKQDIELLGMLKEKTKGNLTDDEQKLFDGLLSEVRVRFVEASKGKA